MPDIQIDEGKWKRIGAVLLAGVALYQGAHHLRTPQRMTWTHCTYPDSYMNVQHRRYTHVIEAHCMEGNLTLSQDVTPGVMQ